ncbi:class I SAM-dependent methyltransferase [Ferrimonas sp.]|uniref:class I SAM-dependent methyltransferase n=1 Tax=Ferrimonas sp. TaxID=2080861 RepID=UPI003A95A54C
MAVSKEIVESAYQKYARKYDLAVRLYRLIGLDIERYREKAVDLLELKKGDCVLELGCGTGLNFDLLMRKIGREGHLVGVDFSSEMLSCAQERVNQSGWENVQLVHSDISKFDFPAGMDGIIATGVFGYLEDRKFIIEKMASSIAPGGRISVVDGKYPSHWPTWLFRLFVWLSSPFGLTEDYFRNDTCQQVRCQFQDTSIEEVYGGLMYILSGSKS